LVVEREKAVSAHGTNLPLSPDTRIRPSSLTVRVQRMMNGVRSGVWRDNKLFGEVWWAWQRTGEQWSVFASALQRAV